MNCFAFSHKIILVVKHCMWFDEILLGADLRCNNFYISKYQIRTFIFFQYCFLFWNNLECMHAIYVVGNWALMHIGSIWKKKSSLDGSCSFLETLIAHSKHSFGAKTLAAAIVCHFGHTTLPNMSVDTEGRRKQSFLSIFSLGYVWLTITFFLVKMTYYDILKICMNLDLAIFFRENQIF